VRAFATDAMYTIGVWKTAASWIVVLGLIGAVAVKQLPGLPLPAQTIATALACLVIGTGTLHVGEEFAVVRANQALHDELHAEAAILRAAVEDKLHGSARLEGLKVVSAMTNQTDWVLDTRKTTWDLRDARALVRTVYVGQIPGCLVRLRKQLVFEGAKLVCR